MRTLAPIPPGPAGVERRTVNASSPGHVALEHSLCAFEQLGPILAMSGYTQLLDHEANHVLEGNARARNVRLLQVDAVRCEGDRSNCANAAPCKSLDEAGCQCAAMTSASALHTHRVHVRARRDSEPAPFLGLPRSSVSNGIHARRQSLP
jgi:hypothetical protein